MYNYPFFSFPHFRRYPTYSPLRASYIRRPIDVPFQNSKTNRTNRINTQSNFELGSSKVQSSFYKGNNKLDYLKEKNQHSRTSSYKSDEEKRSNASNKRIPAGFSFLNNIFNQSDRSDDEEYFELLGLKLYYDDLLLIGLIFFLYKEDVKDQYLFFALILLLLS